MGPSTKKKRKLKHARSPLYDVVRERDRLWSAWEVVNRNAIRSDASSTRQEAEAYRLRLRRNLEQLARKLADRRFLFEPQRAVAIPKPNSAAKRPLVVAPIANRIVQRSLLDTLQELPSIRSRLTAGFNFGGVEGKGVPDAVGKVAAHAASHPFFIRTDVAGFFQHVRRKEALDALLSSIDEPEFVALVTSAITTELDDATQHLAEMGIFPLHEEGVAQGSCLSPLLCNVLLHPFDKQMNDRGIVTVRYIDDFILLAKNEGAARKAFSSAQRWLSAHGLSCYDPANPEHSKKAEHGTLEKGATFLGCEVLLEGTRPSRENFRSLEKKLEAGLAESLKAMKSPAKAQKERRTFADTLKWASDTVRGWGNTFGFCSDERLFRDIDATVSQKLSEYELEFMRLRHRMSADDSRRATGVFLLQDRKTVSPPGLRSTNEKRTGVAK